jgi:NADP-dependent 3-hydroxy acid dehydrogenase YdfG
MNKTILITGASRGIGAACVRCAVQLNLRVIATARSTDKLDDLQKQFPTIQTIIADISADKGRETITSQIKQPLDFLLHNAAVLYLPKKLIEVDSAEFSKNISTNVEPLLFLTQQLLPQLQQAQHVRNKARILTLTSRAANNAYAGIGSYCVSKAAALMVTNILKAELESIGILINSYSPGVVGTAMQKTLRSSNNEIFPCSNDFKQLKTDNKLVTPERVAEHILTAMTSFNETQFMQETIEFKP